MFSFTNNKHPCLQKEQVHLERGAVLHHRRWLCTGLYDFIQTSQLSGVTSSVWHQDSRHQHLHCLHMFSYHCLKSYALCLEDYTYLSCLFFIRLNFIWHILNTEGHIIHKIQKQRHVADSSLLRKKCSCINKTQLALCPLPEWAYTPSAHPNDISIRKCLLWTWVNYLVVIIYPFYFNVGFRLYPQQY